MQVNRAAAEGVYASISAAHLEQLIAQQITQLYAIAHNLDEDAYQLVPAEDRILVLCWRRVIAEVFFVRSAVFQSPGVALPLEI